MCSASKQPHNAMFVKSEDNIWIETLLVVLHMYVSLSPKRRLGLQKFVDLLETKGRKILQNVKIRWVNMSSPLKRELSECCTF